MKAAAAAIALLLGACAQQPCKAPKVVQVTVTKYVPVPAQLTAPVPTAKPTEGTVAECVDIAVQRAAAIGHCNAQLQAIRQLQEPQK